jgi:alpha-L-fucosidase
VKGAKKPGFSQSGSDETKNLVSLPGGAVCSRFRQFLSLLIEEEVFMRKVSLPASLKRVIPFCLIALIMPMAALAQTHSLRPASPLAGQLEIENSLGASGMGDNKLNSSLAQAAVYQPTWASVDQHNPAPEWLKDAKFGIYFHWGIFSVPAFGSEWYPRNMYNRSGNSSEYQHHIATYGDPLSNWPFHNFINGANDRSGRFTQFAPRLASAGGAFDPDAWAQLFADAGAKFAGPVAEHHDGFSMWNSRVNEWNSVNKGPRLDLAGLFATAFRAKGLKFLIANHTAFNFTGYYQWVPPQSDPSLQKLYGQLPATQEHQLWLDKLKETIDQYQPDIIWHDFNLSQIPESYRLQFLAYYFNKGIDWNKEVATTYKDGFNQRGEILDFERGGPGDLTSYYWLTDDAISSSTWGFTQGMRYYSTAALLHSLIDRVSKNGNLLLNVSPMADGTIPQEQKDILLGMGNWLRRNGEAIYSTRAWTTYGEGPTKMGGGTFQQPIAGTAQDIRFTRSKDNRVLYATVLGWPGNGAQLKITSLASGKIDLSTLTGVQLINNPGSYTNLSYRQDSTGLNITMPASQPFSALAYAFRLTFSGQIPPQTAARVVFHQDVNYGGTAVALGPGTYTTAQLAAAGIPNNWVSSVTVPAGHTVEIYDLDNLGGTRWTFTSSNSDFVAAGLNDRMSSVRITNSSPFNPNVYYKIVNKAVGKVIDSGGATTDGSFAKLWSDVTSDNLRWQIVDTGGGWYKIVNRATGKVLDSGGATADGSNVKLWSDVTSDNLRWQIVDTGGGYYKIINRATGKVIDSAGATADGSNVKLWSNSTSDNQLWQIIQAN